MDKTAGLAQKKGSSTRVTEEHAAWRMGLAGMQPTVKRTLTGDQGVSRVQKRGHSDTGNSVCEGLRADMRVAGEWLGSGLARGARQ